MEFVGIQVEKSAEEALKFLRNHKATYPAGMDSDLAIAKRFGFTATPFTVIIDRRGQIAGQKFGPAGPEWLESQLEPLLTAVK